MAISDSLLTILQKLRTMDANNARICDPDDDGRNPGSDTAPEERALSERLQMACTAYRFRELSNLTRFHHETIRRYIRGESVPSPIFLARLCTALKISVEWLVLGKGVMRPTELEHPPKTQKFLIDTADRLMHTAENVRAFARDPEARERSSRSA